MKSGGGMLTTFGVSLRPSIFIVLALFCWEWPALAADLAQPSNTNQEPFATTAPIGFASEFPRSPLEDIFIRGSVRFLTKREAHLHCPEDIIVQVGTLSNIYRSAPAPSEGAFMCRTDAIVEGDRPR
ncbi:hypothetical protein [Lichenifustis flavocetrariae]|uniref:Uncharacterized protein n=1 Tax=Lichenifustis flavocetrariae TaxID=2949735 RepID=A0AA41Z8D1_9HYPH|nr:hypothetical protein [Lichenifustis flavocetrariae]MCW6512413.1 hypothetical protein [Lichenifustis flavocetrariae]